MPRIKKSEVKNLVPQRKLEDKKPDDKITVKRLHRAKPLGNEIAIGIRDITNKIEKTEVKGTEVFLGAPLEEVKDENHTLVLDTPVDEVPTQSVISVEQEDAKVQTPEIEEVILESDFVGGVENIKPEETSEEKPTIELTHIEKEISEPTQEKEGFWMNLLIKLTTIIGVILGIVLFLAFAAFLIGLLVWSCVFLNNAVHTLFGIA